MRREPGKEGNKRTNILEKELWIVEGKEQKVMK